MNLKEGQILKVYKGKNGYFTFINKHNDLKNEWVGACVYLQFRKGVELEDKTIISLKDAWLTCYKSRAEKIVLYVFVNDFEYVLDNN